MTTPPTTPPASYCPDAAHTLQWGLHPDSTTQGWILGDGSSVVAALDGYPHGRTPVLAGEARAWADRILGAAQEWVEQPARSGAYHRHNTVAASPVAAPPTGQAAPVCKFEEGCHRVVACEPGCGTPWPTADRAGLRDRIRRAVCEAEGFAWDSDMLEPDEYGDHADTVLAALFGPIPADTDTATWTAIRAIQLMNEAGRERDAIRERAAELARQPVTVDRGDAYQYAADAIERMQGYPRLVLPEEIVGELRRLAAETQGAHSCGNCEGIDPDSCLTNLDRPAVKAQQAATETPDEEPGRWCKCRSCWGWFVEDHPGEDLDELGRDLGWWSGLPEHRDAPAVVAEPGKENGRG